MDVPFSVYYVDINPKVIKMGMHLRPLVVASDGIRLGKKETSLGFFDYLKDPKVWVMETAVQAVGVGVGQAMAQDLLRQPHNQSSPNLTEEFEDIPYASIKGFSTRKLFTGDLVIDIIYTKDAESKKLSFFVCNQYNTLSEETEKLYQILKAKINP